MVFYTKIVMRLLLFLQRVTFICNLLFLLCLVILYAGNFIENYEAQSLVIILGFVGSLILGFIVNLWEIILLFNRKHSTVPVWLRTFNFILFIGEVIYHLS